MTGNILIIKLEFENITEIFSGFGIRGVSAESVAEETIAAVKENEITQEEQNGMD